MKQEKQKSVSNAGNLYLIFLGLLLLAMGAGFMALMWVGYQRANITRSWRETPCLIIKSQVKVEERTLQKIEYQWDGQYSFEINGQQYVSSQFGVRSNKWSSQKDQVEKIVEEFSVGSSAVCFVNPKDYTISILQHDSKGAGYSIWFPGLFAVGGLGMIIGSVRKWNRVKS